MADLAGRRFESPVGQKVGSRSTCLFDRLFFHGVNNDGTSCFMKFTDQTLIFY